MQIAHNDAVFVLPPGAAPDYNIDNPLVRLAAIIGKVEFALGREHYVLEHAQYLVPFNRLELYSPSDGSGILQPENQDNKEDFQKQNLKSFDTADTMLVRGWAMLGDSPVPFVRISYHGGPDSALAQKAGLRLGSAIKLWVKIGPNQVGSPLNVPFNDRTQRYEVELWGYAGGDFVAGLGDRGRAAAARGELLARPDLVRGAITDFHRENVTGQLIVNVAPDATMHPILPLYVELAWADATETVWDSNSGQNYRYVFSMIVRGTDAFLEAGGSANPHGGFGTLEYRNLLSNYFAHKGRNELGRTPASWSFDAFGQKQHGGRFEPFMAVDYMDLHLLAGDSGIGLHRHRDNSEIFLVSRGRGLMVIGDWVAFPDRERAFEARTLREGHFAMLRGGQLHALFNLTDEPMQLFMFGGYD